MYAVIKTGGKQYRVAPDDIIEIEKVAGEPGALVEFGEVLMLAGNGSPSIGSPLVSGAKVTAEVVRQARGDKVIVFKKRRRHMWKRKRGHRQFLTTVKILELLAEGQKASKKPTGIGVKPPVENRKFELLKAPQGGKKDDLSLIDGVGPKMLKELNRLGVFHFWQLAAMSKDDVEALEDKGEFGGRIEREEWVAQAKELLAGKPPRAKSDRERAKGDK